MDLDADTTEYIYETELNGAILLGYGPWRDQSEPFIKYSCFSYEPIAKHLEALIVELRKKKWRNINSREHEI